MPAGGLEEDLDLPDLLEALEALAIQAALLAAEAARALGDEMPAEPEREEEAPLLGGASSCARGVRGSGLEHVLPVVQERQLVAGLVAVRAEQAVVAPALVGVDRPPEVRLAGLHQRPADA